MKIGIITIHNSPNYGASLQAFALWKYLDMQGHDVEIVDLYRPYQEEYVASRRFKPFRSSNPIKVWLKTFVGKIQPKKTASLPYSVEAMAKIREFESSVKLSPAYKGIDALYASPPLYDIYIAGSDQLWNPNQPYCLEPYFLTFVPEGRKKISYATSIGITDLKPAEREKFRKWLAGFDEISVRERQAKELLETFVDRDIYRVADPTFLIGREYWKMLARKPKDKSPYILLFTLWHRKELLDYSLRLGKESGLPVIYLCQTAEAQDCAGCRVVKDAGIEDFLGYVANADMVVTESFHGTVFSLILGAKNVFVHIVSNRRGSRIEDLLDTFCLKSHILPPDFSASYGHLEKMRVNARKVSDMIISERNRSVAFLEKCING